MADHPLVCTVATWTTDAGTLARAREIGAALDDIVARALAQTGATDETRTLLHEAVRQLDLLPQPLIVNMPGATWTRCYEQQRGALHQRAVELFGRAEGQRVAPALEYEPTMTLGRSIWH